MVSARADSARAGADPAPRCRGVSGPTAPAGPSARASMLATTSGSRTVRPRRSGARRRGRWRCRRTGCFRGTRCRRRVSRLGRRRSSGGRTVAEPAPPVSGRSALICRTATGPRGEARGPRRSQRARDLRSHEGATAREALDEELPARTLTRSVSPRRPEPALCAARPIPSSRTSTCSRRPTRATRTETVSARACSTALVGWRQTPLDQCRRHQSAHETTQLRRGPVQLARERCAGATADIDCRSRRVVLVVVFVRRALWGWGRRPGEALRGLSGSTRRAAFKRRTLYQRAPGPRAAMAREPRTRFFVRSAISECVTSDGCRVPDGAHTLACSVFAHQTAGFP